MEMRHERKGYRVFFSFFRGTYIMASLKNKNKNIMAAFLFLTN